MTQQLENQLDELDFDEELKHLVFRLGDELYATKLVRIKEISKLQPIKPVPYMVECFLGIINLRGQIVGVVDLRQKFDLSTESDGLLIIVESDDGAIGAIVDDVVSVNNLEPDAIEEKLAMRTKIPMDFFVGVAHLDDRLVNVIDIGNILSGSEFRTTRVRHA